MKRSARLLCTAILVLGPAFYGCSGPQPFWKSNNSGNQPGGIAATSPSQTPKEAKPSLLARMKNTPADRSVDGPLALARLAEQRGKTVEAERIYKSILEKSPQNKTATHRIAVIEARRNRFEEAEKYFDQALRLDPDDPDILCDAGYCQFLQHRVDQAEGLYRRALEIDSNHQSTINNFAMLLGEKGEDQAALKLFRQTGTEAQAQTNMGFVYSRRGEIAKAKEAYSQALTLDPKSMVAAEALIQLAQFEKRAEKTVAQSSRAPQDWTRSVADIDANAGLGAENRPATPSPAATQVFQRQPSSVQAMAPASVSRPDIRQPAPPVAARTAEFVSTSRPEPAIQATAYPNTPLTGPSDSGEAQATDQSQAGAALQAIAEGFSSP